MSAPHETPGQPEGRTAESGIDQEGSTARTEAQGGESVAPLALWVDDSKPAPHGCAVARTYDDAIRMMRRFRYVTLYLDHDLGEPRTGYDLLVQAIAEGIVPPTLECISWNPVGRERIAAAWADYTASNAMARASVLAVDPSWSTPDESLTAEVARLRSLVHRLEGEREEGRKPATGEWLRELHGMSDAELFGWLDLARARMEPADAAAVDQIRFRFCAAITNAAARLTPQDTTDANTALSADRVGP